MRLHLIRHGEALASSPSQDDFHRALSPHGLNQASELGDYLDMSICSTEVWCSTAIRTQQTIRAIANKIPFKKIVDLPEIYLCSHETFLTLLWDSNVNEDLIIVSHNFGISRLAQYLTDESIDMDTCDYLCIEFEGFSRKEISAGTGTIIDQFHPS